MPARRHSTPIVIESEKRPRRANLTGLGFRRHVTAVVFAVATLFAAGAAFDLILLWGFQRAPDPSWEFFAIATTVEGMPRLVLGIGLSIVALYLAGSTLLLAYRVLGGMLIATGVAGLGLAVLVFLDFFALQGAVPAEQQAALVSVAAKAVFLGLLEGLVLVPAGWRCFRRPS